MGISGAKAALQGYRLQALFTLAATLRAGSEGLSFHLEGNEDLDLYRGDQLIQVIQVKAYSGGLSLSSFSPEQKDSFLRRAAGLASRPSIDIIVATFGPVGPELEGAWAGEERHRASVVRKLREQRFTDEEIERIFQRVRFQPVSENALRTEVFSFLSESLLGGDPDRAFELLMAWLYLASEERRRITRADVETKVISVGRYLAERAAHHQEWFTSITPLEDSSLAEVRRVELKQEYYRGVAARYDHILAGHDVVRASKLRLVDEAFRDGRTRVVIVHGASGQGKTTLALRYLHDFVPQAWRFAVRLVTDRTHALRVAAALAGHLRVMAVPMYVYIDVSPRDLDWPELVRALVELPNLKVLVTIREEDLARLNVSDAELGFPRSLPLDFSEAEAEQMFESLVAHRPTPAFLSFRDAWKRFGGGGPLLEFTYLVTQSESLEATLTAQVRRLRTELTPCELSFLRMASVAGACEARVDVVSLARELGLVDPVRTLELLEREYLVRRSANGRYAEPLHAIRSSILAAKLTDPAFASWADTAAACIQHVPEPDLEAFLFHSFVRRTEDAPRLLTAVSALRLRSWTGLAGVGRSLLWLGLRQYVERNHDVLERAYALLGVAWFVGIESDLASVFPGESWGEQLFEAMPEMGRIARDLREQQTSKSTVFDLFSAWLSSVDQVPEAPMAASDWLGMAELCFWALSLGLHVPMVEFVWAVDFAPLVEHMPLQVLGEVVLALSYGPSERFLQRVLQYRDRWLTRFCETSLSIFLEETGSALRTHFIVPFEHLAQNENQRGEGARSTDTLHDLTMERVYLLRQLVPGREKYGAQGYGHQQSLLRWPYDPTESPGVIAKYLPPRWAPLLNGTFINLVELPHRPATWADYAEQVMAIREAIVLSLKQLRRALVAHFRSDAPVRLIGQHIHGDGWDRVTRLLGARPLLPRSAVDEWGFVSEKQAKARSAKLEQEGETTGGLQWGRVYPMLEQHQPFLTAMREYFQPLANFFNQAMSPLAMNNLLGRASSAQHREQILELARSNGLRTDLGFLSTYNLAESLRHLSIFQQEFGVRFERWVGSRRLRSVEAAEAELLPAVWSLWYHFAEHPEHRWKMPEVRATGAIQEVLERYRRALRQEMSMMEKEGIQAGIRSEQVRWEGRPALWLTIEVANPLLLWEALLRVVTVLGGVLGGAPLRSLEWFALEMWWPAVIVVPLLHGSNPDGSVWRFRQFDLRDIDQSTPIFIPVPLPKPTADELDVSVFEDSHAKVFQRLKEAVVRFWAIVAHVADFRRIPVGVDETGLAILGSYTQGLEGRIAEALGDAVSRWDDALEDIRSAGDWEQRPTLMEIHQKLLTLREVLQPFGHLSRGVELALPAMAGWARRLQASFPALEAMRLARIAEAAGAAAIKQVTTPGLRSRED